MYSDVVMEVGKKYFEELIDKMKEEKGVKLDVELTAEDLKTLASQFKAEYKEKIGTDFPSDAKEQLIGAVKAVFRSWDNPRANVYRRDNDIPYSWGTAVNVQMMAFGNMGDDCGTGVAFTRDPATGENGLFGEFLTNAQGEDVVAGVRTPMHISEMEDKFPEAFKQFKEVCKTLETHYRDMQDMEFTVEHGKLYMLQTRNGKRTAQAALKIACDLVDEGMRTEEEAVAMIDPRNLDSLLHPHLLRYITSLYTSHEKNPHGSQLIFTSHNTAILMPTVLRRDEIWLCSRPTGEDAQLYPLHGIKKKTASSQEMMKPMVNNIWKDAMVPTQDLMTKIDLFSIFPLL